MPFTPFHFGIALPCIFWDWKKKRVDIISALIGTVIIDIRSAFLVLFTSKTEFGYHGILHNFLAAIILGILVGVFVHLTRNQWNILLKLGKWEQKTSLGSKIIVACIFTTSHILLDAAIYEFVSGGDMSMAPLQPFASGNPLYGWLGSVQPMALCVYGYIIGIGMYIGYLFWFNVSQKSISKDVDEILNSFEDEAN
ncbi:hypothetical protein [Candidatus Lokiarchaeum ossiferum]|uniref:hypothetical protein n=1 Tax=Candidatus Lokiarchaeum ossiferum TaxID=2951803 RepID=UPI00352D4FC6